MSNFAGGPGCTPEELRRAALFKEMTGDRHTTEPTPLMELFGEIAIPLCEHAERVQMRVWHTLEGWKASWGIGGSVGGSGATPEDAILSAHENYIRIRERNALKERVARLKRDHKKLNRKVK